MRKQRDLREAKLTKGTLPPTRSALLARIKEIKQTQTKSKSKSGARGPWFESHLQRRCCGMEAAWSIGGDSLWNISRKPLSFEYLRRWTRSRPRGLTIEYTLIALMVAFAAFQVLLAVGAKAGSI
jgi:hypothetical protein